MEQSDINTFLPFSVPPVFITVWDGEILGQPNMHEGGTMIYFGGQKGDFQKFSHGAETSEGFGEMFEGDFANMCANTFPLMLMGGRTTMSQLGESATILLFYAEHCRRMFTSKVVTSQTKLCRAIHFLTRSEWV